MADGEVKKGTFRLSMTLDMTDAEASGYCWSQFDWW